MLMDIGLFQVRPSMCNIFMTTDNTIVLVPVWHSKIGIMCFCFSPASSFELIPSTSQQRHLVLLHTSLFLVILGWSI